MTKALHYLTLLACLWAGDALAQSTGAFARLGFGARGMAMSNALVADVSGYASGYFNPALAPFTARQHAEAGLAALGLNRQLQYLHFATALRPRAGISAGLIHAGVSDIDGRDASGFHTQTYATDELAAFLAFGTRMGDRVTGGLMFRFYRSDLLPDVDPALSIGISGGVTVRVMEALTLGLAIDDLLARYNWDTSGAFGSDGRKTTDRFPIRLRLGGSYQFASGKGVLAVEYESLFEQGRLETTDLILIGGTPIVTTERENLRLHSTRFRLGGEWWLAQPFALRMGFDQVGADALDGVIPSAGFAIQQDLGELGTRFEYAFRLEPYSAGGMHLLSIQLNL